MTMVTETTQIDTSARRSVAVPETRDPNGLQRMGIRSDGPNATFTLGREKAPGGQRTPWIYVTAEDSLMAIDLDNQKLKLMTGRGATMQTVEYDISSEAMDGTAITVGETFEVVFSYGDKLFSDQSSTVKNWLATTGAQWTGLTDRLPTDDTVAMFNAGVEHCDNHGRFGSASRAPRSAKLKGTNRGIDVQIDLDPEHGLPQAIQTRDPRTGKLYVGREWRKSNEVTTVNELVNAGYSVVVLEFRRGDRAILFPNFKGGLGVEVRTNDGQTFQRILDNEAADAPLGRGQRLDANALSDFQGDRTKSGRVRSSDEMLRATAIGHEVERDAEGDVQYPMVYVLDAFRDEVAQESVRKDYQLEFPLADHLGSPARREAVRTSHEFPLADTLG